MGYYLAFTRKEILSYATIRMNLEDIMLNEMSVTKDKLYIYIYIYEIPKSSQIYKNRK